MRDAKSIISKYFYSSRQLEKQINAGLAKLYLDEQVITALGGASVDDCSHIYLLTDKNRLIICYCLSTKYEGLNIFKDFDYSYYGKTIDLNSLDEDRISAGYYKKGLFGKIYKVTLSGNNLNDKYLDKTICTELYFFKESGEEALKKILAHKKKYSKTKDATAKAKNEEKPKAEEINKSTDDNSKIKEIRKLHEDGLISKEEMLDLLKSAVNSK